MRLEIEIPRSGMNSLRRTQWGEGERPSAKATVREGGIVYNNVAVHLKGAAGSFRPVDDRPALTLNFDKLVPGQSFHGLHKISLNNSVQDPSFLSEKICRELFDAAGVPVPRAAHALVTLNGRDLGLYVLLEGANKQFLKRYFSNTKGNLYDGGFVQDIHDHMAVNSGDNPDNHSGLTALLAAERQVRKSNSLAPMAETLDLDRFISMVAMEVIVCHWDGYALNKNNWRLFHDLDSNRMVMIPHGLDQTFGVGQHQSVSLASSMHWQGRLAAEVLRMPEGQRRYRERVGELITNVFKADQITARVDEIEAQLQPALRASDLATAKTQEHQATWLKQRIARRAQELRRQLAATSSRPGPIKFGSNGVLRLGNWQPSSSRSGNPRLNQTRDGQGNTLLIISAGETLSVGSWRTRAVLPNGRYRFEGKLKLNGVLVDSEDGRSGAGLRVSRMFMPRKLSGSTADWTEYLYEFEVVEETADVEMICELKALKGEVWFDQNSLRLIRIQ